MIKRTAIAVILLLLLSMLAYVPSAAHASSASPSVSFGGPIEASLSGPTLISSSTTQQYVLTVTGGPAGNYSYTAYVSAKNTTGLSPTPTTGTSADGIFYINVTTGGTAEVVTLTTNITAGTGNAQIYSIKSFLITVVNPITITVPVTNEGSSGVQNANVSLYVNNKYIESRNLTLSAGQTSNVTFSWLSSNYPPGTNTATVIISSSGQLFFANGQVQTSFPIYIPGGASAAIDNYIILGCVAAAIALFMIYFRKPKPRF